MAKQDWEKEGETLWFNKKHGGAVQIIEYTAMIDKNGNRIRKNVIYGTDSKGKKSEKRVNTKQQALNYANAYMRTH